MVFKDSSLRWPNAISHEKSHPVAALLSTIALFTAGFLVRPLGAFVFGWMGDRIGRKYTFLVTLTGMALGTGDNAPITATSAMISEAVNQPLVGA